MTLIVLALFGSHLIVFWVGWAFGYRKLEKNLDWAARKAIAEARAGEANQRRQFDKQPDKCVHGTPLFDHCPECASLRGGGGRIILQ